MFDHIKKKFSGNCQHSSHTPHPGVTPSICHPSTSPNFIHLPRFRVSTGTAQARNKQRDTRAKQAGGPRAHEHQKTHTHTNHAHTHTAHTHKDPQHTRARAPQHTHSRHARAHRSTQKHTERAPRRHTNTQAAHRATGGRSRLWPLKPASRKPEPRRRLPAIP